MVHNLLGHKSTRATFSVVAGVDEVGRGPLAGPVTAAAVILDVENTPDGIGDSKRLPPKRRQELAVQIKGSAVWAIAHATVEEIDRLNILQASLLAMRRAVEALSVSPDYALIDGNRVPEGLPCPAEAIIQGDALSISIGAASIIAKVARDQIMADLAILHPGYGWERNMGYPSAEHRQALLDLGVTAHHRRSFRPVHNILCQQSTK